MDYKLCKDWITKMISQLGVLMCYQMLHSKNSFFIIVNLDIALFAAKQKENSSIYMVLNILKSIK